MHRRSLIAAPLLLLASRALAQGEGGPAGPDTPSPASLLAFAECCRNEGRNRAGRQVIPARWLEQSWRVRTASRFTGDGYGYGWFLREMDGVPVHYGGGLWRADALCRVRARDEPRHDL